MRDEELHLSDILDEIMSGMSSNLFETIREQRGLAYYVGSSRIVGMTQGLFYFYAGTNAEHIPQVREEIAKEVERVRNGGLLASELKRVQKRMQVRSRTTFHSRSARSFQSALNVLYGRSPDHWKTVEAKIQRTTLEDLTQFAQKYWAGSGVEVICGKE